MKNTIQIFNKVVLLGLVTALLSACAAGEPITQSETMRIEEESVNTMVEKGFDQTYQKVEGVEVIYLAGGCFWGLEKLMQSIPGVINVVSGYANGKEDVLPTYERVSTGQTGYRETVRVEYKPDVVSLDALLYAYYHVIDPTIADAQGNDRGTQYQTGVYYADESARMTVERITAIEKDRHDKFVVEIKPLERFYDAEEYHQNYLDKNPLGYCHISRDEMSIIGAMVVDPGDYIRPSDDEIRSMLSEQQYNITQNAATEPAFMNAYWDNHEAGIYVDIVTGEPLFSSRDKFDSGTGWPSFTQPIDENTVRLLRDTSLGMDRIEVRSRAGNSHLGHLFYDDPVSPTGTRYCMNSGSLRFVPYADMEAEGYGYLLAYVDK